MKLPLRIALALALPTVAHAQLGVETTFDPPATGGLCSIAFDGLQVVAYDCNAATIHRFDQAGNLLFEIPRPGGSANDVDLEIAPKDMTLAGVPIPSGTVLHIDGESGVAEIYALDPNTGAVLATLVTAFGNSHVVGGGYHVQRDSFFLVQDTSAGGVNGNQVAEVDIDTGAVLNNFFLGGLGISIGYGDLDVSRSNEHLYLASSAESSIFEVTVDGVLVEEHPLPAGVNNLSGLGIDDSTGKVWVSSTSGDIFLLGGLVTIGETYCSPANPNSSGLPGEMRAVGSTLASDDSVLLLASNLAPNQFGYFLNSLTQGSVVPPGSQGVLCLSALIGRYNQVIGNTGGAGELSLQLSLPQTPTPSGTTAILAGQTWNFQCWFRDTNPGNTSNFTDAVQIVFE